MSTARAEPGLDWVLAKLAWMRERHIWPNGLRYLWTDAFGLVLLLSLYRALGDTRYLQDAEALVHDVDRVLGRPRGLRIGEAPDRDGQYFHYLAMWMFALARFGDVEPAYRERGIALARDIHASFVVPGVGVIWKMREDLSGPYPGYGLGAMDAFDGYVSYRLLDERALQAEIHDMRQLVDAQYRTLDIDQDLGLGMMLWLAHFFPDEAWARVHIPRSLAALDRLWIDPPGYFARSRRERHTRFAFTNYGVGIGLQAAGHAERVPAMHAYFDDYRSGDAYESDAITHVMGCVSHWPCVFLRQQRDERRPAGLAAGTDG